LKSVVGQLAINNKTKEAIKLIYSFYEPHYRRNTLIYTSNKLLENSVLENSFIYLDSLYKDIDKEPKYGLRLLQLNAMIGGQKMHNLSMKLIKEVTDTKKTSGTNLTY
jgi:hypothetical protein